MVGCGVGDGGNCHVEVDGWVGGVCEFVVQHAQHAFLVEDRSVDAEHVEVVGDVGLEGEGGAGGVQNTRGVRSVILRVGLEIGEVHEESSEAKLLHN